MATYLEDYTHHLTAILDLGGDPDVIDQAMHEYNAMGRPSWVGSPAFDDWVMRHEHTCSSCSSNFKLKKKPYSPWELVQCSLCFPVANEQTNSAGEDPGRDA